MIKEILTFLVCPKSGQNLLLKDEITKDGRIQSGNLVSEDGKIKYEIVNFIPRFVEKSNYADNFGMQWNKFRKTQLDSFSKVPISEDRFWKSTGWKKESLKGNIILDAGCGSGRFSEIALKAGATIIAIDYSNAVDAAHKNLGENKNFNVIQADLFNLPFKKNTFDKVFCFGVLQHTPKPSEGIVSLSKVLKIKGKICVDIYWKRFRSLLHVKYLLRPFTKRMNKEKLLKIIIFLAPFLLMLSSSLLKIPFLGKYLYRLVPFANYKGIYPLNNSQLLEWGILDTFDMLSPTYDNPQSQKTLINWLEDEGFEDTSSIHSTLLAARGTKK